jgi:NTE family protein
VCYPVSVALPLVELLAGVPLFAGLPAEERARLADAARLTELPAGTTLVRAGEVAEELYVVVSGRLRVEVEGTVVRHQGRGTTLGELAFLTGGLRTATVVAVRDTVVAAVGREAVSTLLAEQPSVMAGVVEVLAQRLVPETHPSGPRPSVVTLRGAGVARESFERYVDGLAGDVGLLTSRAVLRETGDPSSWGRDLDEAEATHQVCLLVVPTGAGAAWAAFCARQADREVVVDGRLLSGDRQRLARRLTGRAVGIVLSGGGARGVAHIGVVAALQESGVVVDRWGGTSMGAFVAALHAQGASEAEALDVVRREWVEHNPFRDLALSRHSLLRSGRASRMLERLFGDTRVEDLPSPYFSVSCDLDAAVEVVHRTGRLAEAVGASMSIPGLVRPRDWQGHLLVDGGVLNNLPVDVMADEGEGPVVAVDVMRPFERGSGPRASPSLVETVGRSMVLGSWQKAARHRELADLLVLPELGATGMFQFGRLEDLVRAGREATTRALEAAGSETIAVLGL